MQALLRLIGDRALACKMGDAGREMVQEYALPRVLGEMDAIYRRFLR
jgi:hypothetical protein